MNKQITEYFPQYLEILWRRRSLFLLPFLAMIPVSLVIAMLAPKVYTTKSLVVLQDTDQAGPLIENANQAQVLARLRFQEQIVGLEAWLKSDHVLSSILQDLLMDKYPQNPRERLSQIKILRSSLSLRLIGNNALEFELQGGQQQGLARKLEVIMSRFFEGLERPDQNTLWASQFLLIKRKEDMESAEKAYLAARQKLSNQGGAELQTQSSLMRKTEQDLKIRQDELGRLKTLLAREIGPETDKTQNLVEDILIAKKKVSDLEKLLEINPQETKVEDLKTARQSLERLENLKKIQDQKNNLQDEINRLSAFVGEIAKKIDEHSQIGRELPRLERRMEETRSIYEAYQKRYSSDNLGRNVGIFSALERMVVIGRPIDPEFSVNSRSRYMIIGILFGIFMGLGLVTLAEMIDQRIYHLDDFVTLTSSPVIARLPNGNSDVQKENSNSS